MNFKLRKHYVLLLRRFLRENGQDLIEYALLVALLSCGSIAAVKGLATQVNTVLTTIGTSLTSNT